MGLAGVLGERIGIVPVFNSSALLYAVAGVLALLLLRPRSRLASTSGSMVMDGAT